MKYKILGKPIPLARPRFYSRAITGVYDPQKKEKDDAHVQLLLQRQSHDLIEGPISLEVTFFMKIPASASLKKKEALIGQDHYKKPDLSNLIKFLEDVAQGIIFKDDSQIVSITAKKMYDEIPRTEFSIRKDAYEDEAKKIPQD